MRVRLIETLVAALAISLPAAGGAQSVLDAPHDKSYNDAACENCHGMFQRTTSGKADYNPGCTQCHNGSMPTTSFAFPWADTIQAVPGKSGVSHSWSGSGESPQFGAKIPGSSSVQKYMLDGKLQCITCHNLHANKNSSDPASLHTSFDVNAVTPIYNPLTGSTAVPPGTGQLALMEAGTTPKGYRIKVLSHAGSAGTFAISHDFAVGGGTDSAPYAFTDGVTVTLDDPAVKIRISAGAKAGDYWTFYISHPMLRLSNIDDGGCLICHGERSMNHTRARGMDGGYAPNGVRKFSHPVGVSLNTSGYTDRATIRDANGGDQGLATKDAIGTNDLALDGAVVRCTTCHAVHNADSNSLSEDDR